MAGGKTMMAIVSLAGKLDPSLAKTIMQAQKMIGNLDKKSTGQGNKALAVLGKGAKAAAAGIGAATAAAAAAVAKVTKESLDSYASYEQLVGGVDTLFKDSSGQVQEYAANAYKTAGMSANTYMETVTSFSASLLQSLGGDTAAAAEMGNMAVTDMSDNANKMGTDIASIQNAYQSLARGQYGMLDNLKLGYGGTKGEMERLIADANKLREANGQAGDLSIDKFGDVVQAIHDVQTQMGITGTTAKEASTTIEGSVNSAKAAYSNWLVSLARDDGDVNASTQQLLESVGTAASNIIPRVIQILQSLSGVIQSQLPGILNSVISILPQLIQVGFQIVSQLVTAIIQALPQLLTAAAQIVLMLAQGLTQAIPQLIPVITNVVLQMGQILVSVAPQLLQAGAQLLVAVVTGIMQNLPQFISSALQIVGQFAMALVSAFPQLLQVGIQLIIYIANGILQSLPQLIATAAQIVSQLAQAILANIPAIIQCGIQLVTALAQAIVTNLPSILASIGQGLLDGIGGIFGGIGDFFGGLFGMGEAESTVASASSSMVASLGTVQSAGISAGAAMTSIPTGLESSMSSVTGFGTTIVGEVDQVNSALSTIGTGVDLTGISGEVDQASSALSNLGPQLSSSLSSTSVDMSGLTSNITTQFSALPAQVGTYGQQSWQQFSQPWQGAGAFFQGIWSQISGAFQAGASAASSASSSIQGSLSGISGQLYAIVSAANSAASALRSMASAAASAGSAASMARAAGAGKFATGGFTNGPSIAGEDPRYPTEAVISFNPAYRSQNIKYLQQASRMLGVSTIDTNPGPWSRAIDSMAGSGIDASVSMENNVSVGDINFTPSINISGNANQEDIIAALRAVFPEFQEIVNDALSEQGMGSYGYEV